MTPRLARRTLLTGAAAGLAATACTRDEPPPADQQEDPPVERLTYGDDPSQWADLQRPQGRSRGVVAVIHGGFWRAAYGADLGSPLARDLTARGWTTLNLEYRRVGNGGGFPETLDDVSAALDLARRERGPLVTLGHSAGGHLATWAAARTRFERWRGGAEVTHALSQAGVVDLTAAAEARLGSGAVESFMGVAPGRASRGDEDPYDLADPMRHVPLAVPVWCVHARDDADVPFSQSADYVARATAAGARAELVEVPGGHFGVIDTRTEAWARVVEILDGIA